MIASFIIDSDYDQHASDLHDVLSVLPPATQRIGSISRCLEMDLPLLRKSYQNSKNMSKCRKRLKRNVRGRSVKRSKETQTSESKAIEGSRPLKSDILRKSRLKNLKSSKNNILSLESRLRNESNEKQCNPCGIPNLEATK